MPLPIIGAGAILAGVGTLLRTVFVASMRKVVAWVFINSSRWLPSMIGYGLAALGLHFLVIKPATGVAIGWVTSRFNVVTGTIAETLYYCNVDDFVTIILSAHAVTMTGRMILRRSQITGAP